MIWSYKKSRETARRMDCYAGEVTGMHPHFRYDSPARALDMDLETTKAYGGPNHLTAGLAHGSWSQQLEKPRAPAASHLTSNQVSAREDLKYTKEDDLAIDEWVRRHVETTWHSLGTCSVCPHFPHFA